MALPRALVTAVVGGACVIAAGVGSYVAVRTGTSAPQAEASSNAAAKPASGQAVTAAAPENAATVRLAPPASRAQEAPLRATAASAARPPAGSTAAARAKESAAEAKPATPAPMPAPLVPSETTIEDAGISVTDLAPPLPEPAKRELEELTIPSNAVIGFRLDTPVSSETARVEDPITARVTRDVAVGGRTAIPSGSRLEGNVTVIDRGGKFRNAARLGIRFMTVVLADNTRVPIQTETIFREGEPPGNEAASKVGASAVVGTILGAILGGKKGAAIGTTVGAAGGAAAVAAGDPSLAVIPAGVPLTVRLTSPTTVVVEKAP